MRVRPPFASARSLVAIVALVALLAPPAVAGQQAQFRSTVELVQLQVGIADAAGAFVSGLTAEDFFVVVDGQERPATVAYEVDLRSERSSAAALISGVANRAPRSARPPKPVAARRHFVVFFDLRFTSRRGILEARESALEFVDTEVHADDLLAVATADRYGIELLTPFTANHGQARRSIDTLGLVDATDQAGTGLLGNDALTQALSEVAGLAGGDVGALSQLPDIEYREYVANVSNYTGQMRSFGKMLQAIEGRKHVILFSRGFEDRAITGASLNELAQSAEARGRGVMSAYNQGAESAFGSSEVRASLRDLVEAFRGADAVVHAIDPTGMQALGDPSRMTGPGGSTNGGDSTGSLLASSHQSLVALSEGTGGSVHWNLNDIAPALAAIEDATASFYMIAYRKEADDPSTVDIDVQVRFPGARVVSAPTRLTPPPGYREMDDVQRQLQLAEFLNDDVNRTDIDLRASVVAFPTQGEQARVMAVVEVNGTELERLASERGEDRVQLEIGGFAVDEDNQIVDSFRRGVTIDVAAMRAAGPLYAQSFRYSDYVDVPPGDMRLRLLVRETEVGRLSSTTREFRSLPVTRGMRVLAPLVVAEIAAVTGGNEGEFDPMAFGDRRLVPLPAPELTLGESFLVLIVAYGLPRDQQTGEILAKVGLELDEDRADAAAYVIEDFQILGSTHDATTDATLMLVQARLPGIVRPGGAGLWAHVLEEITGEAIAQPTDVFVLGPATSSR